MTFERNDNEMEQLAFGSPGSELLRTWPLMVIVAWCLMKAVI